MCDGNDDCFHFDNKKNKNGTWVCKQSIYEKTKVGKKQQKSIYDNRKKKIWVFYQPEKTQNKYCVQDYSGKNKQLNFFLTIFSITYLSYSNIDIFLCC